MFVTPASFASFGRRLTHDAAERLARNWTTLLLNGVVLIAFELRRLPEDVDQAFADRRANGATGSPGSDRYAPASPASSS